MQKDVKLHHPLFGNKHKSYFVLVCALYIIDAFLIPNMIQLLVTMLMLIILYLWNIIVKRDHWTRMVIIRFIQILSVLQVLATIAIDLPFIADSWQ